MTPNADILVVDDTLANLQLLSDLLRGAGYRVRPVASPQAALQAAAVVPPELILLDINMPGMDGFTVCSRLKADPRLADIPVIFISASDETQDKVAAFAKGGVDYVTKPFQAEEVLARVGTHLRLCRMQRQLTEYNRHLDELVQARTAELAKALARLEQVNQAKGAFLTCISHTLRTPIHGILGICDLVLDDPTAITELRDSYGRARDDLMALINQALLLTELNLQQAPPVLEPVPVVTLVPEALALIGRNMTPDRSGVRLVGSADLRVLGAHTLLVQGLAALVDCAMHLVPSDRFVDLDWGLTAGAVAIICRIPDAAVPPERLDHFFEILSHDQPVTPGDEVQLRPALARRVIELCGGTCLAGALPGGGIQLTALLPQAG